MSPKNIVTILVCPENPDNIGAAARAVKNMGFSSLRLVAPPTEWRRKGKKMAMSAADILARARVFPDLKKATGDLQLVVGTTRRASRGRGMFLDFTRAMTKIRTASVGEKIGLVFGCESKGLANKDSRLCDFLVTIPTGRAYPSLNLAQAVMVLLFSISLQKDTSMGPEPGGQFLSKKEIDVTMMHWEEALRVLGYGENGARLLPRILRTVRGIIKRSGLLAAEAQMIKGLSRRIREKVLCLSGVRVE